MPLTKFGTFLIDTDKIRTVEKYRPSWQHDVRPCWIVNTKYQQIQICPAQDMTAFNEFTQFFDKIQGVK